MFKNVIPFKKKKVSEEVKIDFLRNYYNKKYEAEDKIDDGVNIPFFLRAESKVNEIILTGSVDLEYNKIAK